MAGAAATTIADWITAISQLVFALIFVLLFLGFNQKFQVYIWSRNIKTKLAILERMAQESKTKTINYMKELGTEKPEDYVDKAVNYFVISPVDIEPTDIIRRMENVFKTREQRIEGLVEKALEKASKYQRSITETAMEISGALTFVFKYVRHLLLTGQKTNNWVLIMQLEMLMPQILRQAKSYRKALDVFMEGKPIGDGAGPLTVFRLAGFSEPKEIAKDTVYFETSIKERKTYLVKASGPESNVGHPGIGVENLIEKLVENGEKIGLIITVDAALKLEGETTGEIAEGAGAAIGDPGPEKIRIERTATKHGLPLHAIVVKMSMEEAISTIKKEVAESIDKVVARIEELAENIDKNKIIVIAGIGNSVGVR